MRLLVLLPHGQLIKVGYFFGGIVYHLAKERLHITRVNVRLCFPDLSPSAQEALSKSVIRENVIGLLEVFYARWRNIEALAKNTRVIGLENATNIIEQGGGIMVGAHYSTLDMGGALISKFIPLDVIQRPHNNPVFNWVVESGRYKNFGAVLNKTDVRGLIKRLKQGNIVWYPADQDYGPDHAVFVPFFGNTAATITATSRMAAMSKKPVFFIAHHRDPETHQYIIELTEPLESFPSDNPELDATRVNQILEGLIRKYPQQYLWTHKRFKTRSDPNDKGVY